MENINAGATVTLANGRKIAAILRRVWGIVHNVVAHPLLEVLPEKAGSAFHDWTARRAYHEQETADLQDGV